MISGSYVRPWDDGAVASVPVLERPPIADLDRQQPEGLPTPAG